MTESDAAKTSAQGLLPSPCSESAPALRDGLAEETESIVRLEDAESAVEAAFFAWSERQAEEAGLREGDSDPPLSPEELELSFFSEVEGDLLNEEDFFFPAQSSSAEALLVSATNEQEPSQGSSSVDAATEYADFGEVSLQESHSHTVPKRAMVEGEDSEDERLFYGGTEKKRESEWAVELREPFAGGDGQEKDEESKQIGTSPDEIAVAEIFGALNGPEMSTLSLHEETYRFDQSDADEEVFREQGVGEDGEEPAIFVLRDEEVSENAKRLKRPSVFGRPVTFHGNYRRFLVQLVLGLFVTAPLTFWLAQRWSIARPVQWTLGLHTLLGVFACLVFSLFPYHRRRLTLDDVGIAYEDELRVLYVPWSEIEAVYLHAVEAFFKPYPLCYARVVTVRGDEFCFANFGNFLFGTRRYVSFGDPPYPIVDMRDADLLLALIIQQVGPSERTPDLARLRLRVRAEVEQAVAEQPPSVKPERPASTQVWFGIWAFMMKLFFGFLSFLPTGTKLLLKSIKPAYAGVSLGIYAVFFRWEFALLLCVILIFHELGHVWAMQREGMQIRGVFLIPFFGAATVTDDVWPSWYAQARVNLAGPLWGSILTFLCLLAYAVYPADFFLAVAIWGALINLLNLMPVHPLDGGRILHAVACSLRSSWGFVAVIGVLALTVLFALVHELILLYLLAMIGVAEFFKEFMARRRADKMALLQGHATITPYDTLLLKGITGINFGERSAPHFFEMEEVELKRLRMILHAPPMRSDQIAKIGVASFLVAASLLGFLLFIRALHPHAMMALEVFR